MTREGMPERERLPMEGGSKETEQPPQPESISPERPEALTAIFAKLGVVNVNSDLATLVRTAIIFAIAVVIVTARGEWQRPDEIPARAVLFLVLSGFATGLSWLCYLRALQIGPVPGVVAVDKLSVVFVVALAALFIGERLTWQVVAGAFLVAAGALLVSLSPELLTH